MWPSKWINYFFITIGAFQAFLSVELFSQTYSIDATDVSYNLISGHLNMGNPGSDNRNIRVNSKYLIQNNEPIIPVMGEFHYSRCKKEKWEDILLKMKANGISIIATYTFWIHHEEEKGIFDWEGNKDLRDFVILCKKHALWVYPRIGPWCHGEVRNGGLPDWIVNQQKFEIRRNDPEYQFFVNRWYEKIASQLSGLYYKDNGPVIGIQLENEYWRGIKGEEHIMWLKKTALKHGIDVPLYTVTGWRNASVPKNEVIPLWGGYPAAPWKTNLDKIENNSSYVFRKPINDESIGHKLEGKKYQPDYSSYPYFTCELGVGNQISEHRRPVIHPHDGLGILIASLASGSNLPGYYVFAGGSNPTGKFTTLEENRIESGYWNEYPDISYDFQAAIKESGELAPSYHKLKNIHYFLGEFGNQLATMKPFILENYNNTGDLQLAVRCNENSGFLFVSNYCRGQKKSSKENVKFSVKFKNETLNLPSKSINIQDSTIFIWPLNLSIGNTILKYATAQLICSLKNGNKTDWFFFESDGITPEFKFSEANIQKIVLNNSTVEKTGNDYLINSVYPGIQKPLIIYENDTSVHRIFILTKKQAEQFWYFKEHDSEYIFISNANLVLSNNELTASSTNTNINVISFNCNLISKNNQMKDLSSNPKIIKTEIHHNTDKINCELRQFELLNQTNWLKLSADKFNDSKILHNKQFFKNFSTSNLTEIKKATLFLLSEEKCMLRVNGQWVNQPIESRSINTLDLTGYLKSGNNKLMLNFPLKKEEKAFTGILEIEYYNAKKDLIYTDSSWMYIEQYRVPAPWDDVKGLKHATSKDIPYYFKDVMLSPNRYLVLIDTEKIKQFENNYIKIRYTGDKAQLRLDNQLVADNFNNGTVWSINLSTLNLNKNSKLFLELIPYQNNPGIYFDRKPLSFKTELSEIWIEPEYTSKFLLSSSNSIND
jgi:hypothetical protein